MSLEQRNAELEKKLAGSPLPLAIEALIKDASKRKRQVRLLTISIFLDILLTIGLAVVSLNTHKLATQADSNQQAIIRSCETGNEARANNKQLWTYLLNIPTPNAPTFQQQQVRDQFSAFVDKTFAPRDCSKVVN